MLSFPVERTHVLIDVPPTGHPTGIVRAGFVGVDRVGSAISWADIATFLVAQLTGSTCSRVAPPISN
jgi:hypothetical protein